MKKIVSLFAFFIGCSLYAQVTIIVDSLPKATPKNASIFISGSFEGWSGGKKEYQLAQKNGFYSITLNNLQKEIQFKFTQGSWKSVECDVNGASINNHSYTFNKPNDTLKIKIAAWDNAINKKAITTASKNVSIISKDFEIPQLNRKRTIRLYLPPGYTKSKEAYPVLYMQDGQNLFDTKIAYSGEWSVDETLNKLFVEKNLKVIVVAIDNGGAKRLDEYSPWRNNDYGGGEGEAYTAFIVKTLKPYIDANFRTLKDKKNTAIIGSSMGGLISYYAGLKYSRIFGKVGVYSPSFWFAPEKVKEFSKIHGNISDTRMFFLAGGKEGKQTAFKEINQTVRDMYGMIDLLKEQGFPEKNIQSKIVPEGKHNEELWRTNFEETILWLFKNDIKNREFIGSYLTNNQLTVNVSDGTYKIRFYSPSISETSFIPKGEKLNTTSHAVVLKKPFSENTYRESNKSIIFKTKDLSIVIRKKPFNIAYWYKEKKLISEKNGYQKNDDFETLQFKITSDEILYGGGARALGMNRRGNRLQLYNKADYGYEKRSELMNFTMPLVISSKKYMIHFDNAPIGYLDLDSQKNNMLTYETISGRKTYQVIGGNSWFNLIDYYTDLTGKQPLPPRWALGNFSSRFGYHSQKETETTIEKFKKDKIPVDAVILDLYWFGKTIQGTMGNLEVYKDSFPDIKGMISKFKKQGVKTVLITEPFVLTSSKKWKETEKKQILAKDSVGNPATYSFYFGNTGIIDIYKKQGKDWFWNIYKGILNLGVKGLWGDLGEPEVLPSWVNFQNKKADEIHNIYGHDWARLISEGYKKEFPNERPFILMRAGYSGSQRFGMIPWSGDVNRTWGGLHSQPEIALQMGMQGLGYMHSDLGGFAGANLDDNLYTRWLQYGVFQPIYRPHAQEEVASEPVFRSDVAKKLAKESIELRYQLLPYNYNLAFENNQKGTPLMRPIFFEEENEKLMSNSSTYLWGKDFLITPILKDSVTTKEIYFPKTTNWFNFYSDKKVEGGQTKSVKVAKNSIPTYVRAGAFIVMAKPMQSTEEYTATNLNVHYYHDTSIKSSERQLYNDDGKTANAFEKGMYELLYFKSELTTKKLTIFIQSENGKQFSHNKKNISLIVHNIQKKPKSIKVGSKKIKVNWNTNTNKLTIPFNWNTKSKKKIVIKF